MAEAVCVIIEIRLCESGSTVRFDLPPGMIPAAGEYLLGCGVDGSEILPVVLYLTQAGEDGSVFYGDIPQQWTPGVKVWLRGPAGKGFRLPAQARKVALGSLSGQFSPLLPVAQQAIDQSAAVSLFCERMPQILPSEVEALPLEALADAWSWADYAAFEAKIEQIDQIGRLLALKGTSRPPFLAEILILSPFACAGAADCGVCAVKTGGRYRLCCKDGPVFDLHALEF